MPTLEEAVRMIDSGLNRVDLLVEIDGKRRPVSIYRMGKLVRLDVTEARR